MITYQVNGKPSDWTPEIQAKWDHFVKTSELDFTGLNQVNYFTPRPYVDQYNRGSREEGFTYTIHRNVCLRIIKTHNQVGGDE